MTPQITNYFKYFILILLLLAWYVLALFAGIIGILDFNDAQRSLVWAAVLFVSVLSAFYVPKWLFNKFYPYPDHSDLSSNLAILVIVFFLIWVFSEHISMNREFNSTYIAPYLFHVILIASLMFMPKKPKRLPGV